jgi:Sortilin, neurotensin receptor 3,
MKIVLTLLSILLLSTAGISQNGVYELMEKNDISITDAQRIAQRHFDTVGTGKGTGYKQFQRWLYERKFHTDENGYYISTKTDWEKYQQSLNSLTTANRTEAGNWTELGPWGWNRTSGWNPGTGRLSALAVNPANQNNIYAGSPGGGIWKTINGGTNWTPLTDNNTTWMSIFALAIDPANTNRIYAGTSGSAGVIISADAGATWSSAGGGPSGTVRKILIHPSSTNIVFAACTNGVWRSVNNGTSWTLVHSGSKEDIEFKPDNPDIMYATGNDVYRSIDNGVTWTNIGTSQGITNTGRTLVAVSAANPNYVYICQASGSLFGRIYKSTDAGLTFTTTVIGNPTSGTNYFGYDTNGTGTTGQAAYDMGMDVSPTNASEVYIAGIICWKSTNEATSFTAITAWSLPNGVGYNHADVHGLFWVGNVLYSISDGGVYKSTDNGDNWTDITTGMGIRQFYRIANSQTNATVITGGAQDNGSVVRQASTGNWADWLGADGMEGLVSPTNHLNIWGTSQNGAIYRSTNGGNSYSGLGQPSSGQWVTPLAIHPTNETIIYGGWTGVYKSTNSGSSWTNLSSGVITVTLSDLAIAHSDPNYIYASTGNTLFVTTNDGATWATRAAPATINDIAVDPTDPSKIWVALNSTTNRVMVSIDAGATFTNVSANLPSIVARTITVDDNTPRNIYVGLNIGVYHKTEPDANWTNFSDNLPLVAINELEIQKAAGKIRVATYGRGVWESPLSVPNSFDFTSPAAVISSCPAPATMVATLGTIQNGTFSTPIVLTAAGNPSGTTVSFIPSTISPGNSITVTLNGTNTLNAGSYTITVTGTAGSVVRTRDIVFTITTGTGPAITGQPAAQTVCVGSNATFAVTAAGTYQWQVSTDGGGSWTNAGGTSPSLTLTAVTLGMNNNQYRCIVIGQCGTTTSTAALLTVNTAATISAQPTDATICAGQQNTFCVTATGTNLTYQWQTAPVCSGSWTNVTGGINPCLTITGVTTAAYRCIVTATGGCSGTIISNCVTLTVVSSVTIITQPVNQTVCEGLATNFTAAGSGSGLTYQWQLSTNGGTSWFNISSATNAIYNTGVTTFTMNGYQYRCIISNGVCAIPGATNAAVLTINTLPAINANPQNTTLCVGADNTFSVSASGTTITYQWQLSTDGGSTYTNIGSANSSTYSITAATLSMNNNRYRCIVSGACTPAAVSTPAVLTVIAPVTINTHPLNIELCSGSNTVFTVIGNSTTAIIYQWQLSTDGGSIWNNVNNANNASLTLNTVTAIMNGNRYRCLLSNTTCTAPAISNAAILTVRATPTIGLSASPITALLPGQTTILTSTPSTSTGGNINAAWMYNTNPLTVTGNTYTVDIEHTGAYQIHIQESWFGGLICTNQSPLINITAAASERLFIFPSPNDGRFTVSYYNSTGSSTKRTVAVFDSKGALIYNASFTITGPYTLLNVNIQPAQKGIYHVVVGDATGKKLITGKVVIQ